MKRFALTIALTIAAAVNLGACASDVEVPSTSADAAAPQGDASAPTADSGPRCGAGAVWCGSGCTDVQNDPANCGGCGLRCATGQACRVGSCVVPTPPPPPTTTCATGHTACGTTCCNLQNDPANCGGCGMRCGAGAVCTNSVCVATQPADAGTSPAVDEWTLDYGSDPRDTVETIRSMEFWQGATPCNLSRLDAAQMGAPLTSTARCNATPFHFPHGATLRFNAEFVLPPVAGSTLTRSTWSCNIAVRGGSFQTYGRAPIARRNGVIVPLHQVDNEHNGCDWAPVSN